MSGRESLAIQAGSLTSEKTSSENKQKNFSFWCNYQQWKTLAEKVLKYFDYLPNVKVFFLLVRWIFGGDLKKVIRTLMLTCISSQLEGNLLFVSKWKNPGLFVMFWSDLNWSIIHRWKKSLKHSLRFREPAFWLKTSKERFQFYLYKDHNRSTQHWTECFEPDLFYLDQLISR